MKYFLGLAALLSLPALAEDNYTSNEQDVYFLGQAGSHEFNGEYGSQFGLILGARNVNDDGFFYGGEAELALITNEYTLSAPDLGVSVSQEIDESYRYGAYLIPAGMQFTPSDSTQVSLYGLVGYGAVRVEQTTTYSSISVSAREHKVYNGLSWGAGMDASFSDWILGLRYTKSELSHYNDEENIVVAFGHTLKL